MEIVVQLALAAIVFGVTISGGSLLWPRITASPRPQLLQQVHDTVVKTPAGSRAAQVLGVSDSQTIVPINLGDVATNAVNSIKDAAQKRAQAIIMAQVTGQLTSQYEKLPKDEQNALREIICKPQESSMSGSVVQ